MRRLAFVICAVLFVLGFATTDVSAQQACGQTAPCCSTAPFTCSPGTACFCSFTCGQDIAQCSCECIPRPEIEPKLGSALTPSISSAVDRKPADVTRAIPLDVDVRFKLTSGPIDLETLTALIQNHTHWIVQADADVAANFAAGFWQGTFADVIPAIARSYRADATIDETTKTITFLRR